MTKKTGTYLIYSLILCCLYWAVKTPIAYGQIISRSSNLNTANSALPSNHIYAMAVDHLGYLWLATPKGAVRYNGYQSRVYDLADGLPNEDVWHLFEDSAKRMWLSSISDEMGYIKNDRYYPVIRFAPGKGRIYPATIRPFGDGIAFLNRTRHSLDSGTFDLVRMNRKMARSQEFTVTARDRIYDFCLIDQLGIIAVNHDSILLKEKDRWLGLRSLPKQVKDQYKTMSTQWIYPIISGNKLCIVVSNDTALYAFDPDKESPADNIIPFIEKRERIVYAYGLKNKLYIMSAKRMYVLDQELRLSATYELAALTNGDRVHEQHPCILSDDTLWGPALGTADKGVYFGHRLSKDFLACPYIDMKGFRLLCTTSDSSACWWNAGTRQMRMVSGRKIRTFTVRGLKKVSQAVPVEADRIILEADGKICQFNPESRQLHPGNFPSINNGTVRELALIQKDTIFALTAGGILYKLTRTGLIDRVLAGDYTSMVYDKLRRCIWLTARQQIFRYDLAQKKGYALNDGKTGLRKGQKVLLDNRYRNIFIKSRESLFLLDEYTGSLTALPAPYRYNDASVTIQNDRLIVAGRFGVLYMDIKGKGNIGAPLVLDNHKDLYYTSVSDVQFTASSILMKTDKGVYKVAMPKDDNQAAPAFRVIVSFRDTSLRCSNGDTLRTDDGNTVLRFDLINPSGRGKPRFFYSVGTMGTTRTQSYGNELRLSGLRAGTYYTLTLQAGDDVWNAPPLRLTLLITPQRWQDPYILAFILIAGAGTMVIIVLLTKKIVLKKQLEKQLLLEMSLKGVYAQLNPHFIFNSLTTTHHLIKSNRTKEASQHLSRFSALLRRFLHASRQKYSTVGEESEHIKNYIELQQSRFAGAFDYKVYLAPDVNLDFKIPALLLQPLVENAIQHGLFNKQDGKGMLQVSFFMKGACLMIVVEDDGIGRPAAAALRQQQAVQKESHGTALLNDLIYIFKKYEQQQISFEYTDRAAPQTGTIIKISIKNPKI